MSQMVLVIGFHAGIRAMMQKLNADAVTIPRPQNFQIRVLQLQTYTPSGTFVFEQSKSTEPRQVQLPETLNPPRPPNYPLLYPKYPLLKAITAPFKGPCRVLAKP